MIFNNNSVIIDKQKSIPDKPGFWIEIDEDNYTMPLIINHSIEDESLIVSYIDDYGYKFETTLIDHLKSKTYIDDFEWIGPIPFRIKLGKEDSNGMETVE